MIRRNFLSLLFGLVSAPAAVAAIRPEDVVPSAPFKTLGAVRWADVDGADEYEITVSDRFGEFQIWRVRSRGGSLHTLTFPAVRNRIYRVKVEAIYPDGSRRNAKQYDVDFVA